MVYFIENLDEVIKKKVSDIKYQKQSRRYSFDKELKTLKAIFNWYRENYDSFFIMLILKRHFVAGVLRKALNKKHKKMTPEQVTAFLNAFDDQFWRDFAQLHFFMARRGQEPGGLQIKSVDFENRTLIVSDVAVYGHDKRFFYLKEKPKNGEERLVHLNETMVSILKRRISDPRTKPCNFKRESTGERLDFVFQEEGQPLNYRQIQYRYNKALKRAGLWPTYKATHILRKAMANIVRQKMGLEAAQAVGGWKTREVVERVYTDEAPSELNKSVVCLVEGLIVTDYQMADGDGLELLGFCQKGQFGIPVIVFHGGSIGPKEFHTTSEECVAVVIKPNYEELKNKLEVCFGLKR